MSEGGAIGRPMLVEKPIKINGYDIDVMGVVSNLVYVRWFEDLRERFLEMYWPLPAMLDSGQSPIIASTHVDYKAPLSIYDKPLGRLWVPELGKARWRVEVEIVTGDRVHCTGWQAGYFYDIKKKRPVRLPNELVETYRRSWQVCSQGATQD